uniref:Phosphoprotein n=1 Tax=Piry virus TaxID=11274 RepID=PHOSP_PIRYV|nr:RecName: Full=Phosphoprotein; Short=Protein P; AltName: Full=Protein M1 [Piry virus]BAA05161.1 P(NS) protein [Piry virus]CAA78805.1 phosphoprotein [Piry virus]
MSSRGRAIQKALANYPDFNQTLSALNEMEEQTEKSFSTFTTLSASNGSSPEYFLGSMLKESDESESVDDDESVNDDLSPENAVEPYKGSEGEDSFGDKDETVFFEEDLPWSAMVQKTVNGKLVAELSAPQGLTPKQLSQWTDSVLALMDLSKNIRLSSAKIDYLASGLKITEHMSSCFSSTAPPLLKEFQPVTLSHRDTSPERGPSSRPSRPTVMPPARTLILENTPSTPTPESTSSASGSPLNLPEIKPPKDWASIAIREFSLNPLSGDGPQYKGTLARLFGSLESALQYANGGNPSTKDMLIAGLRRKGIFNKIRIKYFLDPIYD